MILELRVLGEEIKRLRQENPEVKIVTTNGCFHFLHPGHFYFLKEAKKLGDVLIVGINKDDYIRKHKKREPLYNEDERAQMLDDLKSVDYVTVFEESNPINFLSIVKPDFHVKGSDYSLERMLEREVVESNGGKIVLVPLLKGYSTTMLLDKLA